MVYYGARDAASVADLERVDEFFNMGVGVIRAADRRREALVDLFEHPKSRRTCKPPAR